jgi:hypothetical protein
MTTYRVISTLKRTKIVSGQAELDAYLNDLTSEKRILEGDLNEDYETTVLSWDVFPVSIIDNDKT